MHALTASLAKVVLVSEISGFAGIRGKRVHSTESVPFDAWEKPNMLENLKGKKIKKRGCQPLFQFE